MTRLNKIAFILEEAILQAQANGFKIKQFDIYNENEMNCCALGAMFGAGFLNITEQWPFFSGLLEKSAKSLNLSYYEWASLVWGFDGKDFNILHFIVIRQFWDLGVELRKKYVK